MLTPDLYLYSKGKVSLLNVCQDKNLVVTDSLSSHRLSCSESSIRESGCPRPRQVKDHLSGLTESIGPEVDVWY